MLGLYLAYHNRGLDPRVQRLLLLCLPFLCTMPLLLLPLDLLLDYTWP